MMIGNPISEGDPQSEVDRLEGYVKAAASLRLEIAPFLQDQTEMLRGKRVLYCVDTNIVRLFTAPSSTAPKNRIGGAGYGVVFPDDDETSAGALGAALSRFIFYRLTHKLEADPAGSVPLVLLLGHDAEIRRLYDLVAKEERGDRKSVSERRKRLVTLLTDIAEEPDNEARLKIVRSEVENLFEYLFFGDTRTDHFNRFNQLISDGRIARLDSFASRLVADNSNRKEARIIEAALRGPSTFAEQSEESSYRLKWEERLSIAARFRSRHRLSPDIAALSRLEFINRHLRGTNYVLALITGDESMRRAASLHYPFGEEAEDFATLYLRHPRAFLAADEVLLPLEAAEPFAQQRSLGLISNWLDALLARYLTDQPPRSLENVRHLIDSPAPERLQRLRLRVEESLRLDAGAADRMKSEWDKHVQVLREEHSAPSRLAREEIERILGSKQSGRFVGVLEEVDRILAVRSERTWSTFFAAIVRTGYDLLTVDASEKRSRNAPPLDFDSLLQAKIFARSIINGKNYQPIESPQLQAQLEAIRSEDPTGYAHLLAFATLFANAGRWHVSSLLSTRAITIARRLVAARATGSFESEQTARISGREAFYFTAVASRMSATSLEDLAGLESNLDEARLALAADKKRQNPAQISSIRFDSEALALVLTRILFRFFLRRHFDKVVEIRELRRLLQQIATLYEGVDHLEDSWIKAVVRRNVLTNYFMTTALLSNYPEAEALRRTERKENFAAIYLRTGGKEVELQDTRLVSTVRLFASVAFGPENEKPADVWQTELDELERHLASDKSEFAMPYDRKRYAYLVLQIKRALISRSGV
jgi:hypothetical protein